MRSQKAREVQALIEAVPIKLVSLRLKNTLKSITTSPKQRDYESGKHPRCLPSLLVRHHRPLWLSITKSFRISQEFLLLQHISNDLERRGSRDSLSMPLIIKSSVIAASLLRNVPFSQLHGSSDVSTFPTGSYQRKHRDRISQETALMGNFPFHFKFRAGSKCGLWRSWRASLSQLRGLFAVIFFQESIFIRSTVEI